ncbi:L-2-amino-thiazoline-4-carboxylic acid hydrolase [Bacteroidota bacterium]
MNNQSLTENRRDFLKTAIPAGAMLCMGCPSAFSNNRRPVLEEEQDFETKIKNEFSISWEKYFARWFNGQINWMKILARHIGKDEVIKIAKERADKWNASQKPNTEAKSVKDFILPAMDSDQYKNCLDFEYVEFTDQVCELKVKNCLWAKTWRSKNAGEFGYASVCHGDFSGATAFNPKLRMERTKTLMQGHDCCNHRYIWEG